MNTLKKLKRYLNIVLLMFIVCIVCMGMGVPINLTARDHALNNQIKIEMTEKKEEEIIEEIKNKE